MCTYPHWWCNPDELKYRCTGQRSRSSRKVWQSSTNISPILYRYWRSMHMVTVVWHPLWTQLTPLTKLPNNDLSLHAMMWMWGVSISGLETRNRRAEFEFQLSSRHPHLRFPLDSYEFTSCRRSYGLNNRANMVGSYAMRRTDQISKPDGLGARNSTRCKTSFLWKPLQ